MEQPNLSNQQIPPSPPYPHYTFDRVVRMVLSAITLGVLIWLLRYLSDVLVPFAVAVVFAYILNPLVNKIQRRVKNRGFAVGILMLGIAVVGTILLIIIVPLAVDQVGRFRDSMVSLQKDIAQSMLPKPVTEPRPPEPLPEPKDPGTPGPQTSEDPDTMVSDSAPSPKLGWTELERGWARFRATANTISRPRRLEELRRTISGTYLGYYADELAQFLRSEEFRRLLASSAKSLALGGIGVITFILQILLGITGAIVVLVYLIFLLIDYPSYSKTWVGFLPPSYRETLVEFFVQFDDVLHRYLRGQAIVSLFTGTLECIGFTIIGLPMAIPFGLFVGLLTMVPYLPAISIAPAAVLAVLRAIENGSSLIGSLFLTFGIMIAIQIIQDMVVVPKIMGKMTGLRPVAILLGVFIWGKLLGFLGVVLAIPLTGLGIAYYRRYILQRGIIGKALSTQPVIEVTSVKHELSLQGGIIKET